MEAVINANIIEDLMPLATPIDDVGLLDDNAMEHPDANIEAIKKSLMLYGQRKPIVVNKANNQIEAGNGTWMSAKDLGWSHIAAVFVEDDETTQTGFAIADNRTAQLSKWNVELLQMSLDRFDDPTSEVPGIDDDFMAQVLEQLNEQKNGSGDKKEPEPKVDKAKELLEKWGVEEGQIWCIPSLSLQGKEHRIICGDSTDPDVVSRVMQKRKAKLIATDPPYGENVGVISLSAEGAKPIDNDDLAGEELRKFLVAAFSAWGAFLDQKAGWYVWHPFATQEIFKQAMADVNVTVRNQIIWVKETFVFGRSDYHWQHELCYYGWESGGKPDFNGERNQSTVWNVARTETRTDTGHPTPKPVELFTRPIRNSTKFGDICLEPFAGSGPHFVAGENLGRLVYGCDLLPEYVAVVLERMSDMGLSPSLEGS